ncbi:MAG TPA: hypothetical protein VM735_06525 [Candidatus Kapabacteria bacterium]|nr:hypothetical protein [Candidatus Kapabacteria bacterium]
MATNRKEDFQGPPHCNPPTDQKAFLEQYREAPTAEHISCQIAQKYAACQENQADYQTKTADKKKLA